MKLPWWSPRIFCPVCIAVLAEIETEHRTQQAIKIAAITKYRLYLDARRTDYIPGMPRKPAGDIEYDGPERRKRTGTILDRRGYIRNAQFNPTPDMLGSDSGPIPNGYFRSSRRHRES